MAEVRSKVAVVTGASAGIGRRLAADLARDGAIVVAVARRGPLLEELATEMRSSSPRCEGVTCDVSDTDSFTRLLGDIEERHGRIDLLVNNAGINDLDHTSALEADAGLAQLIFATNFFAVIAGTRSVLPGMVARRSGIIINVSSDSGRAPEPGNAVYSASKAAVAAYTDSVAHEVALFGVHVHVLFPGWVPTAMGMSGVEEHGLPPKSVRRTEAQVSAIIRQRMGGPVTEISATQVAKLAVFGRTFFPRSYQRAIRKRAATHT